MSCKSFSTVLSCVLACTVLTGRVRAQSTPDDLTVTAVALTRTADEKFQALLTLDQNRSQAVTQMTIRLLFIKAGANLSPKTVIDFDVDSTFETKKGYPWGDHEGGVLGNESQQLGFFLDLSDQRGWTGPKPNQILIPLADDNLLTGFVHILKSDGTILAAFVKDGKDGQKVCISNTVRAAYQAGKK
jgi:hypothetical protein